MAAQWGRVVEAQNGSLRLGKTDFTIPPHLVDTYPRLKDLIAERRL